MEEVKTRTFLTQKIRSLFGNKKNLKPFLLFLSAAKPTDHRIVRVVLVVVVVVGGLYQLSKLFL